MVTTEAAGTTINKAERYELIGGYIRPLEGSLFPSYDPMAIYERARSQSRGHQAEEEAPYTSLVRVVSKLSWKLGTGGRQILTPESEELILAWVGAYGLLGLLEHKTLQIIGDFYRADGPEGEQAPDWRVIYNRGHEYGSDQLSISPRQLPRMICRDMKAYVQEAPGEMISLQPWQDVAAPFFPGHKLGPADIETFYPVPDTPGFLKSYSEPVEWFVSAANVLRTVSDDIARLPEVVEEEKRNPEGDFDPRAYKMEAVIPLDALLSVVRPTLWPDTVSGELKRQWRSPSLLGILAVQLSSDLGGSGAFHRCPECETPFFSTGYQAKYCSPDCRLDAIRRGRRGEK